MRFLSESASPSWLLMTSTLLLSALSPANALYFYMDDQTPKCFYEELPRGTLVVGHYNAELYDAASNSHKPNPQLTTLITVDETFDSDHRIVSQRGSSMGRFTFSAADSGVHRLCFAADNAPGGGWLTGGAPSAGVKFTLDLAIGETSAIESTDKGKMDDIVEKVKDLNGRLMDIRREQVFQREREAEFRDQSELTNARVVRWTIVQLVVLGVVCFWQLSHLRAFFIKQKLT